MLRGLCIVESTFDLLNWIGWHLLVFQVIAD
jgi:hypothetical protein